MDRLHVVVIGIAVAIPIGGIGAWAFNPDSGAVAHSLALWRVFGIAFELGLPLVLVLGVVSLIRDIARGRRSRRAE